MTIILGSSSTQRAMLLRSLGISFVIDPPNIDEKINDDENAEENVIRIAREKLFAVAKNYEESDVTILCADTIISIDGKIFGKPRDRDRACDMLRTLSAKTHDVITGFAIKKASTVRSDLVKTKVRFRDLSEKEIRAYAYHNDILDKSGSYAISGPGAALVDTVEGSISNIIGLPIDEVLRVLKI